MTRTAAVILLLLCVTASAFGAERFPPPEFTDHELPSVETPEPRQGVWAYIEYVDVGVLIVAIAAASYFALRRRSRVGVFVVMLFSLAYFGFYRLGCVCAIGAIQNCSLAAGDATYVISLAIAAFFLVPLVATVFFGRTFCAAVCPLGAIQDLVVLRPVKIPRWLESALQLTAVTYLGVAVLLAVTASAFVICRYDPFIALFRLLPVGKWIAQALGGQTDRIAVHTGRVSLLVLGGSVLLVGAFVARPYCRFLCPLAVLFRPLSRLSKWHVTVTPDECVKCRLCEDACPFGAIDRPTPPDARDRSAGARTLAVTLALAPVIVAVGATAGWLAGGPLARANYTVRLAERVAAEQAGAAEGTTDASDAFRETRRTAEQLYADADAMRDNFLLGGAIVGAFVALVAASRLVRWSVRRRREDYQPDRAMCVSCARCFKYCPVKPGDHAEAP